MFERPLHQATVDKMLHSECYPPGGQCCQGGGSCKAGEKCCRTGCAPSNAVCCEGEGYCPTGSACCPGQNTCAEEGAICCPNGIACLAGSQCCQDDDGPYCATKCLPTLIFPNLEGWSDPLFQNMARGIKQSPRGTPETDILTWDGGRGRAGRRAAARRRKAAGCGGGLKCPPGMNCDEWPPASTLEGGAGSVIICVPKELNDWQGTYFASWLAEAKSRGFKSGDQFRVKLQYFDFDSVQKRELLKRESPILSHDNNGQETTTVHLPVKG